MTTAGWVAAAVIGVPLLIALGLLATAGRGDG